MTGGFHDTPARFHHVRYETTDTSSPPMVTRHCAATTASSGLSKASTVVAPDTVVLVVQVHVVYGSVGTI